MMKIIHDGDPLPPELEGASLAIGNFDGIHRGHIAVLDAAAKAAGPDAPFGAIMFEPHPRSYFAPHIPHFRLTPPDLKRRVLGELGLDLMVMMNFNDRLAQMPAADFARDELGARLQPRRVVIGYDFRFGKGRQGTPELLKSEGAKAGFDVTVVEPVVSAGDPMEGKFSSSAIRRMLEAGDVEGAGRMLGRWWAVTGTVEPGDRRGREIGYPTANIQLPADQAPRLGIYAARAALADDWPGGMRPAVAYFGRRPTFAKDDIVLEVHLFDFDGDLYGKTLLVEFVSFIRPDEAFEGIEALTARMDDDAATARAILDQIAADPPLPPLPWLNRSRGRAVMDC